MPRGMKKRMKSNGFETLEFEKGDGAVRRWSDVMQPWRAVSPEMRRLSHPYAWYLDERNLLKRPTFGMLSAGRFAEHLLWRAMKECPGSRAFLKASRLMQLVQRKMSQLRYRSQGGRFRRARERDYLESTLRVLCAAMNAAAAAFAEESRQTRTASMSDALA